MGTYLGVTAVKSKGKKVTIIEGQYPNEGYNSNNILVAIICNGIWSIAPEVTKISEFEQFYDDYSKGDWLKFEVYALPNSEIDNCPDEGRVPCN